MEPNNSFNGPGNGLEPFAQLQVPYHAQYPTLMPFSMSQTRYTPAYHDPPSTVAQQVLLFPFRFANSCSCKQVTIKVIIEVVLECHQPFIRSKIIVY